MAFNGSGTYTLPGAALTTGATVSSTENNTFRNDVATAFNKTSTRDGQTVPTANLPMGGFKHTGLAAGTTAGDSVRYEQLPSASNLLPVASGGTGTTTGYYGFKNRIINGAMMIDQRNAGASGTAVGYTVDRFGYYATQASKGTWQQNAGSVTPPAGYKNYLGFTSSSAYSVLSTDLFELYQSIEGYNLADLGWGAVGAATVTLSFWVRSSLTGTFGGSLTANNNARNYPFTYTISSANTWEQKTVTVAGDTTGTWLTTNGVGMVVIFGLGAGSNYSGTANAWNGTTSAILPTGATSVVGTNGATFYITGVQLEKGSTATSFDYRPYGTELALCQRYYEVCPYDIVSTNGGQSGQPYYKMTPFKQTKRESSTMVYTPVGNSGFTGSPVTNDVNIYGITWKDTTPSNGGPNVSWYSVTSWTASAEL